MFNNWLVRRIRRSCLEQVQFNGKPYMQLTTKNLKRYCHEKIVHLKKMGTRWSFVKKVNE